MQISGTGITTFTCKTLPNFRPVTKLAIQWLQLASGNWVASDRGAASDVYESEFSIYGLESVINNFINQVYAGRVNGDNQITLGSFLSNETIFGENVKHSGSITATILEMPDRTMGSWKGFGLAAIRLRALIDATSAASFTGASTWPTLQKMELQYRGDATYTISKYDSYTGAQTYLDKRADAGIFEGTFYLRNADLLTARNYIRTQRTGNFTLADTFNVDYPFGPRSTFSYPGNVKLIEWEDLGEYGLAYRRLRLRFAEVLT